MENEYERIQNEIMELKYYCNFSLIEINMMTAEDRRFYLNWVVNRKNEEQNKTNKTPSDMPTPPGMDA